MDKAFTTWTWKNSPDVSTPLGKTLLNRINAGIDTIDDRVVYFDTSKADTDTVNGCINGVAYNTSTGVFVFSFVDGTTFTADLNIEKIPVSFSMDENGIITMTCADGTTYTCDIGALLPVYNFVDSAQVDFTETVDPDTGAHNVTAIIKDGSITADKLQPNYLADIMVESANAEASAEAAEDSAGEAAASATTATTKAGEAGISATNAATSESNALASANLATAKAEAAATSESNAGQSATTAESAKDIAVTKAGEAGTSATNAADSAIAAAASATSIIGAEENANTYSKKSQSYAVGGTNTRTGEDTDNAKYYYKQAQAISQSFSGALRPMGTVTFANLPDIATATAGDMYNISDQFTTTSDFKEGEGNIIPAGSNVYKTSDNYWDVLAGSPVTGIKGNAESSYRKGNVNIDLNDLGVTATATELNYVDGVTSNVQTQLNSKVDKVAGKGLSSEDYTSIEKNKLSGIATGAQVNVQSDWNASSGDAFIKNKPTSLPASDVYSWAKQATKPTYTANEVGALASNGTAVNSDKVDNKHIAVVSSMPASPDANTIYFVTT